MVQNSNISISSGAARFINAPIGRKKRAVSSKKPETYRLTHREENKAKKRPQTAPTVSFVGNGSLPVSREWSYVKKKYKLNMPFLVLSYPAKASALLSNTA